MNDETRDIILNIDSKEDLYWYWCDLANDLDRDQARLAEALECQIGSPDWDTIPYQYQSLLRSALDNIDWNAVAADILESL